MRIGPARLASLSKLREDGRAALSRLEISTRAPSPRAASTLQQMHTTPEAVFAAREKRVDALELPGLDRATRARVRSAARSVLVAWAEAPKADRAVLADVLLLNA